MLSKHYISKFLRHSRINYSVRNGKSCYTTIVQKDDHSDSYNEESINSLKSPHERCEGVTDRSVKSRNENSYRFQNVSCKSQETEKLLLLNNFNIDTQTPLTLNLIDYQPSVLEGITDEGKVFVGKRERCNVVRTTSSPVLASSVSKTVCFQELLCARSFHSFRGPLLSSKESVMGLDTKSDADAIDINQESDAKIEVTNSSQVNEASRFADETLSPELVLNQKPVSHAESVMEHELKPETANNQGQNVIVSEATSSYLDEDDDGTELSAYSLQMNAAHSMGTKDSVYKELGECETETNQESDETKSISEETFRNIESEMPENPGALELTQASNLEQTLQPKENLESFSSYNDGKNPIFPNLPLVQAKVGNELTEYQSDKQKKYIFPKVYSLAPLVSQSEVLTELVKLGVDLSEIERKKLANKVVKMDFKRHIKPCLLFLYKTGIPGDMVGKVLTKAPHLLLEDVKNLQVRIKYLKSKKFAKDGIVRMVTVNPGFLLMTVENIDAKLGFLQKEFKLKGSELREMIVRGPKLITTRENTVRQVKFHLDKFYGFTELELKRMAMDCPKLYYLYPFSRIERAFDILHHKMEIPHSLMVLWPNILDCDRVRLETRHRFLLKVGRAQYDPKKENYVSLQTLIQTTDEEFCVDVAKASMKEFYQFSKTV